MSINKWWMALSLAAMPLVTMASALVDGDWLAARLEQPNVVVLDIRSAIDGGSRRVYEQGHIPGAVYSNYVDAPWRAKVDGVVGKLPSMSALEQLIGGLGISNQSHVVVVPAGVSATDYAAATRVYWTFKVAGHDAVSILDGGYRLWVREGRPVAPGWVAPTPVRFEATFRDQFIASTEQVRDALKKGSARFIDNRPTAQFVGKETRETVKRPGHIPDAVNIAEEQFFDVGSGRFQSAQRLAALWREAGAVGSTQVTYCNTGHWGSLGWFTASELLGERDVRLYDGSMTEWSMSSSNPMVVHGR